MSKKQAKKQPSKKRIKKSVRKRIFIATLKFATIFTLFFGFMLFLIIGYYSVDLPNIDQVYNLNKKPTITILDSKNRVLSVYGDLYGRDLKSSQIPMRIKQALLATEDQRFYSHSGIDVFGVIRAIYVNNKHKKVVQGGSTITQQLAKIAFLSSEKSMKRKIQEAILAVQLEKKYSKDEIMRIYLNRVYLGRGVYGIDSAAHIYFGKKVEELTLYESAMIIGMLKAPTKYSPTSNFKISLERAKQVLINMQSEGYITASQFRTATPPEVIERGFRRGVLQNPYFTDYILDQLELKNVEDDIKVYTTLDLDLQKQIDSSIEAKMQSRPEEVAVVALGKDGRILGMSGGKDYKTSEYNRSINAQRQPGSAFKLFVYAVALQNGFEPSSKIVDEPISIGKWSPRNFNRRFLGEITVEEAFAFSVNTVAVKLSEHVGRKNVIKLAQNMGLNFEFKNLPSIALGSEVVDLTSLTSAYNVVANDGYFNEVYGINKIVNSKGKILFEYSKSHMNKVLPTSIISNLKLMMKASVDYGTSRKAAIEGLNVYGKTGTTQNNQDALFVGFAEGGPTIGVWVGNDNNKPMNHVVGGGLPAEIWHSIAKNYNPTSIWEAS